MSRRVRSCAASSAGIGRTLAWSESVPVKSGFARALIWKTGSFWILSLSASASRVRWAITSLGIGRARK